MNFDQTASNQKNKEKGITMELTVDTATKAMRDLLTLVNPNYRTSWDDPQTCACDLLTAAIMGIEDDQDDEEITQWPEWESIKTLIDKVIGMRSGELGDEVITLASRNAFSDHTESFHAAHVRDALRDNGIEV